MAVPDAMRVPPAKRTWWTSLVSEAIGASFAIGFSLTVSWLIKNLLGV